MKRAWVQWLIVCANWVASWIPGQAWNDDGFEGGMTTSFGLERLVLIILITSVNLSIMSASFYHVVSIFQS